MLKVYAMNVSGIDADDKCLLSKMSKKRLVKINRYRIEEKKKQSIGAELLLNYALKSSEPVEWETDGNGKLYVPDSQYYVNLSHSGDYAVCAVSDSEVGVDIQKIVAANMKLAKRFFTEEECKFIEEAKNPDNEFYRLWTRKESLVKAAGKGLAIPLSGFSVLSDTAEYNGKTYKFKEYSVKSSGYKLCACAVTV